MNSRELREKFLKFFEKRGHKIAPSFSLIPTDPSVLFTTAGMQQFKEYYLEKPSSYGKNITTCQKCFRTSDIEEVGDEKHLTFLEMLGNFSFGGYFKKETVKFSYELLVSNLQLPISKMMVTVFGGDKEIPLDKESEKIWSTLGFSKDKGNLQYRGRKDNFWGPTGLEGPCGPTTEINFNGVEVWNLVFNEYYQDQNGKLTPLKQKGVDTGMGLERLAMVVNNKNSVFETDFFELIIGGLRKYTGRTRANLRAERIVADHIKGSVFLISEGILPSNVERGYVLRRILRRAIRYGKLLTQPSGSGALRAGFLIPLAQKVVEIYKDVYPEVKSKESDILTAIQNEEEKFSKTLERGLKQFEKISKEGKIPGLNAFHLFDTYGFPLELTQELAKERGLEVDIEGFKEAFEKHREVSRAGVEKKFGGIGKDATYQATKLHTATHLLHAALRQILGENVKQMGSDITLQRLRFDFSHPQKLTEEELKKVEDLVNQKIKEDLEVKKEEMRYEEAIKSGALAFFKEKYPEKVRVYSIGPSTGSGQVFSKEICAGPHVKQTFELGYFRIIKEESSGTGVRRIRAILE